MKNSAKYVIFRTKWGFFGLLALKNGLFCAHLPCRRREQVENGLLVNVGKSGDGRSLIGSAQGLEGVEKSGCGRKVLGEAQVKGRVVERLENCKFDRGLFGKLQEKTKAYFEGELVEFGKDVPVVLDGYSEFGCKVLRACRKIKYGETVSYGQLAEMAGEADAARAVGGILGANRLPLIVPCHRVIRRDGGMGGFSAAGGVEFKKKMLELERKGG
ncbi:MAG: methylated-DNA--[protein]-cysteine S-methyltransferase [Planctomycetota bacterium]